jgi:hypothetical protein
MMLGLALSVHTLKSPPAGDPLEGYDFIARLQFHLGDNVPMGVFQDEARTIPAVNAFDPVCAVRDEITGLGAVFQNTDPDKQPFLNFIGGVPVLSFDGSDDVLVKISGAFQPAWIAARVQHVSGDGRVTTQPGGGNGGFRNWQARYGGSDILLGTPTAGFDALFIQAGAGTSRTSFNGSHTNQPDSTQTDASWTLGGDGSGQNIAMNLVAIYFGASAISTAQQAVLEAYTANLSP